MATPVETLEKDVSRHEIQIHDIMEQLNDLSRSHAELGFILKTCMEKFPVFEKKIDGLGDKMELLLPNKGSWEMERRMDGVEKEQKATTKHKIWAGIAILVLVLTNPEVMPFIMGVLENKVP